MNSSDRKRSSSIEIDLNLLRIALKGFFWKKRLFRNLFSFWLRLQVIIYCKSVLRESQKFWESRNLEWWFYHTWYLNSDNLFIDKLFFLKDTELLRLPNYQIRQTVAQSKRLDDITPRKPKKNSQKIFRLRNFKKLENWSLRLGPKIRF